ncbi:MAG: hypothetical protein IPL65_00455 [Lewinellaceae bacterium]|nr:hypothetical protein [Lewinellaceae bacterium]
MNKKFNTLVLMTLLSLGLQAQVAVTITGTGTGGWNQPGNLALSSTDGIIWTAENFEIVADGNMKFSEGGTWATTGGYSTSTPAPGFPTGTVTINEGSNIVGDLGFWNVTYNIATKEYTFTPGTNPNPVVVVSGGGLAADVQMNTSNGASYAKKSLYFPGGNASFKQTSPTTGQWGGAFPDGPVVVDGTIPVPAGAYNAYFVLPSANGPAEYIFAPVVVSMIGNFAGSGWNTDLDLETTDNVIFTKSNWAPVVNPTWTDTTLNLKFRDNHDWTFQFGNSTNDNGANYPNLTGTAKNGVNGGGGDIFIPWPAPNMYNVTFNRSTGEWAFEVVTTATHNVAPTSSAYIRIRALTNGTSHLRIIRTPKRSRLLMF